MGHDVNAARKSLRRMRDKCARRILLVLEALSQNPTPTPEYGVKKLAGMLTEYE
ncbi:MAG: type II toxin-antitoxin system RelE family toxin [Candidatus Bathyarchaeia archaeon]